MGNLGFVEIFYQTLNKDPNFVKLIDKIISLKVPKNVYKIDISPVTRCSPKSIIYNY